MKKQLLSPHPPKNIFPQTNQQGHQHFSQKIDKSKIISFLPMGHWNSQFITISHSNGSLANEK